MDAATFRAWQAHMGFNGAETARRLGKSEDTISRYRKRGVGRSESRSIGLACAAISMGLPEWRREPTKLR